MKDRVWVSVHVFQDRGIYYSDGDALFVAISDELTRAVIAEGLALSCFAIRYREGGPHVRWRALASERSTDILRSRMTSLCEGLSEDQPRGRIEVTQYLPEIRRYGGDAHIRVSEDLFARSTTMISGWLRNNGVQRESRRLGLACAATMAGLFSLTSDEREIAKHAARYARGYLTGVIESNEERAALERGITRALEGQSSRLAHLICSLYSGFVDNEDIDEASRYYRSGLHKLYHRLQETGCLGTDDQPTPTTAESVIYSHIHMTNNRLGISTLDEAYVTSAIAWVLNGKRQLS